MWNCFGGGRVVVGSSKDAPLPFSPDRFPAKEKVVYRDPLLHSSDVSITDFPITSKEPLSSVKTSLPCRVNRSLLRN